MNKLRFKEILKESLNEARGIKSKNTFDSDNWKRVKGEQIVSNADLTEFKRDVESSFEHIKDTLERITPKNDQNIGKKWFFGPFSRYSVQVWYSKRFKKGFIFIQDAEKGDEETGLPKSTIRQFEEKEIDKAIDFIKSVWKKDPNVKSGKD